MATSLQPFAAMSLQAVLLTLVVAFSSPVFAQDGELKLSPADLKTSLAHAQEVMTTMKPFLGHGPKYAAQHVIGYERSLPGGSLWMIRLNDAEHRVVISEERLAEGLTVREWTSLLTVIYEVAYDGPFRMMERQELKRETRDPLRRSEAAGLDANALNRLYDALQGYGPWDIARALHDPSSGGEKVTGLLVAYVRGVAAALKIDLSTLTLENWGQQKGGENFRSLIERTSAVIKEERQARQQESEAFKVAQDRPVKRDGTSVRELLKLVEANDREGAARILETELLWEKFTGAEVRHYRRWIESIRKPSTTNFIYLLRGTNPELDSQPESHGLISKLLKTAARKDLTVAETFDGYRKEWMWKTENRKQDLPFPQFGNLAENHSHSSGTTVKFPSGYISTSTSAPVVTKFAKGSKVMIRIDAHRAQPNFETMMHHEREVLLPLLIFPDEVMGLLVKGAGNKLEVRREADSSLNEEATKFLRANLSKDAKAVDYLFGIWRTTTAAFFPTAHDLQPTVAAESLRVGTLQRTRPARAGHAESCRVLFQ